jgi:hypothetical protein
MRIEVKKEKVRREMRGERLLEVWGWVSIPHANINSTNWCRKHSCTMPTEEIARSEEL